MRMRLRYCTIVVVGEKITFLLVAGTLGLSFPHFDFESGFRLNHLVLHRWQFEFMG